MLMPIDNRFREKGNQHVKAEWGGPLIVTKGILHNTESAEGFVDVDHEELRGYVLYSIENSQCEILVLQSLKENCGVGRALVNAVGHAAKENSCDRVWLITTNDNIHAIRYYQKIGFELVAVHINAIAESRNLKPSIPLLGNEDIPIKHEFEFECII